MPPKALQDSLAEAKRSITQLRSKPASDSTLRSSEVQALVRLLEDRTLFPGEMLEGLHREELQHLVVSTYTAAKLNQAIAAWAEQQHEADRLYVLCESVTNLEETAAWLGNVALHGNPMTLCIAPKCLVDEVEWAGVVSTFSAAHAKLEPEAQAGMALFQCPKPPPAPMSIGAFTRLMKDPWGCMLFSDDDLTTRLVALYMGSSAKPSLPDALKSARPLTNTCQIVQDAVIAQMLRSNKIAAKRGQGTPGRRPVSFTPDPAVWTPIAPSLGTSSNA
jgi:hypothetical protein